MRDLGFSDSEAPASKGSAPKPTHIEQFFEFLGAERLKWGMRLMPIGLATEGC
jgi:hypothetical protein